MSKNPVEPTDGSLTEQDLKDIEGLQNANAPITHTLLEMWRDVLSNIEGSAAEKVSPVIALKLVSSWPKLSFQEVPVYHKAYHEILMEGRNILDEVIRKHPGAFKNVAEVGTEFSDAIANREAYIDILFEWQLLTLQLEAEWDASKDDSHIQLAAMVDAAALFSGEQGLIQHLSQPQINFQFTDADRDALGQRLELARTER
jgi:hypothetical protein